MEGWRGAKKKWKKGRGRDLKNRAKEKRWRTEEGGRWRVDGERGSRWVEGDEWKR